MNLMPNYNLAAIWGPTLLTVDGLEASNFARTSGESDVCKDLIDNYEELFNVNQEELERERKITEVLERINRHDRGRSPLKRSGSIFFFTLADIKLKCLDKISKESNRCVVTYSESLN